MNNVNNIVVKTVTSESSGYIIKSVRTTTVTSVLMTPNNIPPCLGTSINSQTKGLTGLQNIGNTCFLNSIVQCLSNTKPLLEYILEQEYVNEVKNSTSTRHMLMKRFTDLIINLWTDSNNLPSTTALKHAVAFYTPRFSGFSQQDAQEFLRYLLQGLHEEINRVPARQQSSGSSIQLNETLTSDEAWLKYLKGDNSKIIDIFGGQLKSVLKCTACGYASTVYEPFWDLSLPIPHSDCVLKKKINLNHCLDFFTKEETLDGNEKPICSRCKSKQICIKKISIQKFPQILVIHLKRFSESRNKVETEVQFPISGLNLAHYSAEKQIDLNVYNLYGVVNHFGTCLFGHYTAYCKHPYCAGWHRFNDSRVSQADPDLLSRSEAYILFYELDVSES